MRVGSQITLPKSPVTSHPPKPKVLTVDQSSPHVAFSHLCHRVSFHFPFALCSSYFVFLAVPQAEHVPASVSLCLMLPLPGKKFALRFTIRFSPSLLLSFYSNITLCITSPTSYILMCDAYINFIFIQAIEAL